MVRRGMRRLKMTISVMACGVLALLAWAATPMGGHWKLVWNDEFNGRRVDLDKWTITDTAGRAMYTGELNFYNADDVASRDGKLILRTRNFPDKKKVTRPYSSGRVSTEKKFSFLYGKVEVRAKLPGTKGLWPAIWLLPADGSWPPEIDVTELLGHLPRRDFMTFHWGTRRAQQQDQSKFDGPDFTAGYHLFTVEWMPGQIRWLIDGIERKVVTSNVPDKPMFLIINTAVGGPWAGEPDKTTVMPQSFLIDYVRVYQHRK
jgi:beta-glucanase (GH16 family)